jgi:hypothetical protein
MSSLSDPKNFAVVWDEDELSDALDPEAGEQVERRYNFRDYWLHGKGAARWVTWEELTEHLTKFLSAKAAKRIAKQWFKERYGSLPDEEPEVDPDASRARAPSDHDGTDLHAYWTRGEGLAKWRGSPHPWQTLHAHLAKYITDPHKLDATTSAWFIDVFGYAAGSDRNRVEHGHKPRGSRVGPG